MKRDKRQSVPVRETEERQRVPVKEAREKTRNVIEGSMKEQEWPG